MDRRKGRKVERRRKAQSGAIYSGQVEELDFPVSYEGMEEREPAG